MKKIYLIGLFLVIFLFTISLVSSLTEVYDDFSGSTLNTDKWIESTDLESWPLFDEHYLNTLEQAYHTAQLTPADRTILLSLTRRFNSGETLEYDVNYQSGSGNILSRPTINEVPLDLMLADVCNGFATCGNIGYWNGESTVGNLNGVYHVKVNFSEPFIQVTFINTLNQNFTYTSIRTLTSPFTFGVSSRTGHNGFGHFDYDNFIITNDTIPPVTLLPDLTIKRVSKNFCKLGHRQRGVFFKAVISNIGQVSSASTDLSLEYNELNKNYSVPSLQPYNNFTVKTECMSVFKGLNTAVFMVDSLNLVQESNESNNEKILSFKVH